MPNFPLQGAALGLCFQQRADSKSSFIQEKTKTKPGDTWTNEEICWSCLWRKEGFGESWQLFLTIHLPFQKANERQLPELNRLRAAKPNISREARKS